MCGIYGFQAKKGKNFSIYEATVLTTMLAKEMECRGRDSFGGITFPDINIYKGLGRITETGCKIIRAASESQCFLGHTRQATVGAVTINNCHPFEAGDVLGVHNGSISNYAELNAKYNRECQVDSEHLFYHINENRPLDDVEGHGTFFWTKKSENFSKIYFARTFDGSLNVVRLYREKTLKADDSHFAIAWASELPAIRKAADLLGFDWHPVTISSNELHFIENGDAFSTKESFDLKRTNYSCNKNYSKGNNGYNGYNPAANTDDDDVYGMYGNEFSPWNKDFVGPDTNDKDVPDVKEELGILKGLANYLDRTSMNLSKRERKAIRRKVAHFKDKNRSNTKEPLISNIHTGVGFPRHIERNSTSDKVRLLIECKECSCPLTEHFWSWCTRDTKPGCKAPIGKGCNVDIPICCDCGHYLVYGVHNPSETYDIVHCLECEDVCIPTDRMVSLVKKFDETEDASVSPPIEDAELVEPDDEESFHTPSLSLVPVINTPDLGEILNRLRTNDKEDPIFDAQDALIC